MRTLVGGTGVSFIRGAVHKTLPLPTSIIFHFTESGPRIRKEGGIVVVVVFIILCYRSPGLPIDHV